MNIRIRGEVPLFYFSKKYSTGFSQVHIFNKAKKLYISHKAPKGVNGYDICSSGASKILIKTYIFILSPLKYGKI